MDIVETIDSLVSVTPGWSPPDQLLWLYETIVGMNETKGDIIEIGSWCGLSGAVMGLAAREAGGMEVHCVDLFPERGDWYQNADGTYSFSVQLDGTLYLGCHEQTVWADVFESQILPVYNSVGSLASAFHARMVSSGLSEVVLPHRGTSVTFAASRAADFRCKLAFIDGEHSYSAVKQDVLSLEPFLVVNGWLCFDDAFSCYSGVDRAITEFVSSSGLYGEFTRVGRKLFAARRLA